LPFLLVSCAPRKAVLDPNLFEQALDILLTESNFEDERLEFHIMEIEHELYQPHRVKMVPVLAGYFQVRENQAQVNTHLRELYDRVKAPDKLGPISDAEIANFKRVLTQQIMLLDSTTRNVLGNISKPFGLKEEEVEMIVGNLDEPLTRFLEQIEPRSYATSGHSNSALSLLVAQTQFYQAQREYVQVLD
ncbi:MAG: hypothetical protein KTR30_09625, partial [Saprospiraceae bacterium]|nr:hypothetical protein [Saprospiraceae bacterium]